MQALLDAVLVDLDATSRADVDTLVAELAADVAVEGVTNPAEIAAALERLGITDRRRVLFIGDSAKAEGAGLARVPPQPDGLLPTIHAWTARTALACIDAAIGGIRPPDAVSAAAAQELQNRLTKPPGALGALEGLSVRLAGMAGICPPPPATPATVAVFAGDHGVLTEGVTPWPQEVTAQMVANFCAGGAAINVLARQAGASVVVVDVGVATSLRPAAGLLRRNVRRGTANLAVGPAMSSAEARAAVAVGIEVAHAAVENGAKCLVPGDMGIGNTTPSAAVIAAITGMSPEKVTGRGTGIDDAMLARKTEVVRRAVARVSNAEPVAVLSEVGGLEIAAISGFIIGGASARVPVVLDGVISLAGALAAAAMAPAVREWMIAGHRSVEPGASVALAWLGLEPLVDLSLRLGEGSGAALALPLVEAAARILGEMATFDSAGVSSGSSPKPS